MECVCPFALVDTYLQRPQWEPLKQAAAERFRFTVILCLCLFMCVNVGAPVSHLSHRRPPKPSLHRHDPAGWPVNQGDTQRQTHTHMH